MEVINLLTDNLGAVAFAILGMGGVMAFCYAGWLYQTSFGDQQQQMKARNAFWGGCLGILIGGFSFAIPEILSSEILGRSGGDPIVVRASSECDEILKNRLANETIANTPERMGQIVRFIQSDNDGCGRDLWNPVIGWDAAGSATNPYADYRYRCFVNGNVGAPNVADVMNAGEIAVGGVRLPGTLRYDVGVYDGVPRPFSSRDTSNNVIVYFGKLVRISGGSEITEDFPMDAAQDTVSRTNGFPTSGERCWLFIARENLWIGN